MSNRRRKLFLGTAFVAIPLGFDIFAIKTTIGPVLYVFPWAEHSGLHVGDVVCLGLLAPLWCIVTIKLARETRNY